MTWQGPTECSVCGGPLTPFDMRRWDVCDRCVADGQAFAKDLPEEHEQETPGVEA